MTTLADIHTAVNDSLARGTTLDTIIPDYVRRAARKIEQNHTFGYMIKFAEFIASASATNPRVIALPNDRVKAIKMVRFLHPDTSPEFSYLNRVDTQNVDAVDTDAPQGYWLDGVSNIVLDNIPDQDYPFDISWAEYTSWPTDLTAESWLITNGELALTHEALFQLSSRLRDKRLRDDYNHLRLESLNVTIRSDEDLYFGDRDMVMVFS